VNSVLFSGSTPTGILTIGNYLGAIRQWVRLQKEYDCIFCIVDLHAITVPRDPVELKQRTLDFFTLFVACGLDPDQSVVFVQSQNHFHAELAWMLNCVTQQGELSRMTQFKDKSAKAKTVTAGLLNYPILMAADILLYNTSIVPVGEDQKQHVELTREIAQRFNARFGEVFRIPEPYIPKNGARIRSLLDPARKMDKSDPNPRAYISLLDNPETVRDKISKAKTDSGGSFPIDDPTEGIGNLVTIYSELTGDPKADIVDRYGAKGYATFKRDLTDSLCQVLSPIQDRYRQIRPDGVENSRLLEMGRQKAMLMAQTQMSQVRSALGLVEMAGTT
jgi:tryptophanyl-tRNA synthetase